MRILYRGIERVQTGLERKIALAAQKFYTLLRVYQPQTALSLVISRTPLSRLSCPPGPNSELPRVPRTPRRPAGAGTLLAPPRRDHHMHQTFTQTPTLGAQSKPRARVCLSHAPMPAWLGPGHHMRHCPRTKHSRHYDLLDNFARGTAHFTT